MKERVNIYTLKSILKTEITLAVNKKKEYDNALYLQDLYQELLKLINNVDIEELFKNIPAIKLLLNLIYSEQEVNYIENNLIIITHKLLKMVGNVDLINEYNSILKKLNKMINKINEDAFVMTNLVKKYYIEYEFLKYNEKNCRTILYRLNKEYIIDKEQINFICELLKKYDYKKEEIIIIKEYINHHNIKVKYDNPIISYTVINLLKSDFLEFEIDELYEKNVKNKLDEYVLIITEYILEEERLELQKEFLDSIFSWMNHDEIDYVLKKVLNNFVGLLKSCQSNMLDVDNYDDELIRRVIIAEYNSYYYKYRDLLEYYNFMVSNHLEEDVVEEINEDNNSYNDNLEVKNNLFFAMNSSTAYAKRDLLSVPEEYLESVKTLLEDFRYGLISNTNIDGFANNKLLKGYKKLKDDQIRIVFRNLGNNNYLILGILVKKTMNNHKEYVSVINRDYYYDISNIDSYNNLLEESNVIYNDMLEYISEFSRKGNR